MQCTECGARVPAGAEACAECGAVVSADADGVRETTQGGQSAEGPGGSETGGADGGRHGAQQGRPGGQANRGQQPGQAGQGQPPRQGEHGQPTGHGHQGQPGAGGQQGQHGGQPQNAQAGGAGGQPSGPHGGPPAGYGAGGGGFDLKAFLSDLPIASGAIGGVVAGIVVFAASIAVTIAIPGGLRAAGSDMELVSFLVFDLQFGTQDHVPGLIFGHFDIVRPPETALGLLYLVAPLSLYTAAKFVARPEREPGQSHLDAAKAGAALVIGYLPLMVVAAVLLPEMPESFSLARAFLIAGVVYPLLFGALGGLVGGYYEKGVLRVSSLYAMGAFGAVVVVTFVTSFVTLGDIPFVEIDMLGRILYTLGAIVGIHGLSMAGVQGVSGLPIVFAALAVFGLGFLCVYRGPPLRSPIGGFAKGITPAPTYAVLLGIFTTIPAVLADGYIQDQLGIGGFGSMFMEAVVTSHLSEFAGFAYLVFVGTVVFAVILCGAGGALATWYVNRNARPTGPPAGTR